MITSIVDYLLFYRYTKRKMKLFTLLALTTSFFAASAFGVNPSRQVNKSVNTHTSPFRKDSAKASPLFRDPLIVRGGAVPGWAAYNAALDKNPLTAKSCTSLVGWALGDVLAQVCLAMWC